MQGEGYGYRLEWKIGASTYLLQREERSAYTGGSDLKDQNGSWKYILACLAGLILIPHVGHGNGLAPGSCFRRG